MMSLGMLRKGCYLKNISKKSGIRNPRKHFSSNYFVGCIHIQNGIFQIILVTKHFFKRYMRVSRRQLEHNGKH